MNSKIKWMAILLAVVVAFTILAALSLYLAGTACHQWLAAGPQLRAGSNWIATPIGGPLEIRPLPPAIELQKDFSKWVNDTPGKRVRLYEVVLPPNAQQLNFRHHISLGDTPVGQAPFTSVQFDYADPTNGMYRFHWGEGGRQSDIWLRVGGHPRRLLVRPVHLNIWPQPEISVVAIEGLEERGSFVAVDDQYLLSTADHDVNFHLLEAHENQNDKQATEPKAYE
jgi:hypothetical protein